MKHEQVSCPAKSNPPLGYSGEDQPRCVLPSGVGTFDQEVPVAPIRTQEDEEQKLGEDVEMN